MKTFDLVNGDLHLGPGGSFSMVTGSDKLVQDIGVALREPYGSDRFHPRWGSILPSFIGEAASPTASMDIRIETKRIIDNITTIQRAALSQDVNDGAPSRFSSGEVIDSIKSVDIRQDMDSLALRITLTTLDENQLSVIAEVI